MEEIQSLIIQGELSQADARIGSRLQLNPADQQLQFLAGVVKLRLGEGAAAQQCFESCLLTEPDHALAFIGLGQAQRLQGQPVAAQAAFDSAVFFQPLLAGAHALGGELAMFDGDRPAANARAMAALHGGSEDPQAPMISAALALQGGEAKTALEALQGLLSGTQLSPRVAQIACAAQLVLQQVDEALALVNRAHTGTGSMPAALRSLQMRALLAGQRRADAERTVRSYVSEHTQSADAWSMAAETELARGQFIHAIEAADRALAIRPGSSHALRLKAMAYLRAGKTQVAEGELEAQVSAYPGDTKSWRMLLAAIIGPGNHRKAQEAAQRWVELVPEEADAHGDLAALMEYNGDLEGAMMSARAALRARPGHINAMLIAARAELRIGRPGPVLARLDQVHPEALDVQQRLARLALLARAADASDDQAQAVARWLEKNNSDPTLLKPGTPKSVEQTRIPAHQSVLTTEYPEPICFLVGLPGSGVQHVAAALAKSPGVAMLGDRFSHMARNDGFARPEWETFEQGLSETQARLLRRRWRKAVHRLQLPPDYTVLVDWLPHLDARMYAAIGRAIPEARFLWVDRDPHDGLLDWLAFSSPHRLQLPGLSDAGQWYANARSHLSFAAADQRLPVHTLNYEKFNQQDTRSAVMAWLGVAEQTLSAETPKTLGGLSAEFAAGHWHDYVDELSAAFAALKR